MASQATLAAGAPLRKARQARPPVGGEGKLIQQRVLYNVLILSCPMSYVPTIISAAQTGRGAGRLARTRKGIVSELQFQCTHSQPQLCAWSGVCAVLGCRTATRGALLPVCPQSQAPNFPAAPGPPLQPGVRGEQGLQNATAARQGKSASQGLCREPEQSSRRPGEAR